MAIQKWKAGSHRQLDHGHTLEGNAIQIYFYFQVICLRLQCKYTMSVQNACGGVM